VYLSDDQFARLEQLSRNRLVTKSNLVRVALEQLLSDEQKHPTTLGLKREGRSRK